MSLSSSQGTVLPASGFAGWRLSRRKGRESVLYANTRPHSSLRSRSFSCAAMSKQPQLECFDDQPPIAAEERAGTRLFCGATVRDLREPPPTADVRTCRHAQAPHKSRSRQPRDRLRLQVATSRLLRPLYWAVPQSLCGLLAIRISFPMKRAVSPTL